MNWVLSSLKYVRQLHVNYHMVFVHLVMEMIWQEVIRLEWVKQLVLLLLNQLVSQELS